MKELPAVSLRPGDLVAPDSFPELDQDCYWEVRAREDASGAFVEWHKAEVALYLTPWRRGEGGSRDLAQGHILRVPGQFRFPVVLTAN